MKTRTPAALILTATLAIMISGCLSGMPGSGTGPEGSLKIPRPGTKAWRSWMAEYKASVEPILAAKCVDCHTTHTHYPWYYNLPLAKGMIDLDIKRGRRAIEMTNGFPFGGIGTTADHVTELRDVAAAGSMPPPRYWVMHWSMKLTRAERDTIVAWAEGKPAPTPAGPKK